MEHLLYLERATTSPEDVEALGEEKEGVVVDDVPEWEARVEHRIVSDVESRITGVESVLKRTTFAHGVEVLGTLNKPATVR